MTPNLFKLAKDNPLKVGIVLVPLFDVILFALLYAFYERQRGEIFEQLSDERDQLCLSIATSIQTDLIQVQQVTHSLAELCVMTRSDRAGTEEMLKRLIRSAPHPIVYGMGVWYEPFRFAPGERFFGPYVVRQADSTKTAHNLRLTYEWATPEYNYVSKPWYQQGLAANGQQRFTSPYFDADAIYISSVQAFRASDDTLLGVVTVDITLDSIREFLTHTTAQTHGHIYLSLPDGRLLFHSEETALKEHARAQGATPVSSLDLTVALAEAWEHKTASHSRQESTLAVPSTGWTIHVRNDDSAAAALLQNLRNRLQLFCGVLLIGSAFAILSLRRHQRRVAMSRVLQDKVAELQLNIEQRHAAEQKLQRRRVLYEGIIHRRTQQLARANANKDQLISILAHDMRNHFMVIKSYVSLLGEADVANDPVSRQEACTNIGNSTQNALECFETLLLWIKLQANRIDHPCGKIDWPAVLFQVRTTLEAQARLKNVNLVFEEPQTGSLHGNLNLVATVLRNVAGNAIKFTPAGGWVTIRVREIKAQGVFELVVQDTGIGMPADKIAQILNGGESTSSRGTANEKGMGLGLAICIEMCRLMRGTLTLRSELHRGTTVQIHLPRPAAGESAG
jgi:signal transduction histidine kinase